MRILAIDPGPIESAYVIWDGRKVSEFAKVRNEQLMEFLRADDFAMDSLHCVIEKIASYGMAVGAEVFETCYWSGRFAEAYAAGESVHRIPRLDVKLHICKDSKAKDSNIRLAIIDRFGGKERAIGKKKTPGPLYGIKADCWAALAVAITWHDKNAGKVAA